MLISIFYLINCQIPELKDKGLLKENDTVVLSGGLSSADLKDHVLATQATGAIIRI